MTLIKSGPFHTAGERVHSRTYDRIRFAFHRVCPHLPAGKHSIPAQALSVLNRLGQSRSQGWLSVRLVRLLLSGAYSRSRLSEKELQRRLIRLVN